MAYLHNPHPPALQLALANMTLYVRSDGSDSNDGRADTAAGAFLTLAKALQVGASYYGNNLTLTIYSRLTSQSVPVVLPKTVGWASCSIIGDATTPANRIISTTSADAILAVEPGTWIIQGFELRTTTNGSGLYVAGQGVLVSLLNIDFGAIASYQIRVNQGIVAATTGNRVVGNAVAFASVEEGGTLNMGGRTLTFVGSISFSNSFILGSLGGVFKCSSMTFVGSFTGKRFDLVSYSVIASLGATEATYFPGSVVGTKSNALWT